MALILTKKDLVEFIDEPVKLEMLKKKQKELGMQVSAETSSKEWEDFNVHKAFVKAIETAIVSQTI